jgi:lipid-A-disaccharide synthase-like uncharacterized protein
MGVCPWLRIQLYLSERQGKVVSPTLFWLCSLGGSLIFLIYGLVRSDLVVIVGQTISYYIYIRNLQLKQYWQGIPRSVRSILLVSPLASCFGWLILFKEHATVVFDPDTLFHPIMVIGAIGQLALNLRFVYQWWYSERFKTSILPVGFWHISTWSSVLVIIYAAFHPTHHIDIVLLVSQGLGIIVYIRNLVLYRQQAAARDLIP